MNDESIDLRILTTAELLNGPALTHMAQCYNWMLKLAPFIWATHDERAYSIFGELQISTALMFQDMAELTQRFGALVAFME